MKIKQTDDNTAAIEFLKTCHPVWIDVMPVTASIYTPGKCNVAQNGHYDKTERRGVLALYYGAGCKRGDDGWSVLVVSDATEGEFNSIALQFSGLAAMEAGLHPSACLQANWAVDPDRRAAGEQARGSVARTTRLI